MKPLGRAGSCQPSLKLMAAYIGFAEAAPDVAVRGDATHGAVQQLTRQAQKVLDRMAQGLTNRKIGEQLFLAEQTVAMRGNLTVSSVCGHGSIFTLALPQECAVL